LEEEEVMVVVVQVTEEAEEAGDMEAGGEVTVGEDMVTTIISGILTT
jgi:hypothetical protein